MSRSHRQSSYYIHSGKANSITIESQLQRGELKK